MPGWDKGNSANGDSRDGPGRRPFYIIRMAACLAVVAALLSGCALWFRLFPEDFPYPDEPEFQDPYFQMIYQNDDVFRAAYDEYYGNYVVYAKIKILLQYTGILPPNPSKEETLDYQYMNPATIDLKNFRMDLQHYELTEPKLAADEKYQLQVKYKPIFQEDNLRVSGSMYDLKQYTNKKLGCQVSLSGGATACLRQGGVGISTRF